MIDTRMKVDGKWNFSMDNVWYGIVMLTCSLFIALELLATYLVFSNTGEFRISGLMIGAILVIELANTRRLADKLAVRVKALESGK
ncbi:hypothetical protein CL89_gp140 [Aeromonas phage PX29]|uniref:Uncharacterized protein n=1 Tax=Aeromonas phage PX29 TaxID=926067 RepID=E5DQ73_9CAUD|nr:hypothetical protein CL89_gp140 [Aeromonas phage PX29]ADQ52859.1 conserved hypothetical protein [Aeromonas phage PX29]